MIQTTRRETLKLLATLPMTALRGVRAENPRIEEAALPWREFCDPLASRYLLNRPFVQNGFRYATDSRIAVRQPSAEPDSNHKEFAKALGDSERRFPDIGKLWGDDLTPASPIWQPWPIRHWFRDDGTHSDCAKWEGDGECPMCDPDSAECVDLQGKKCPRCGDTQLKNPRICRVCGGSGLMFLQWIGRKLINAEYDLRIRYVLPGPVEWFDRDESDDASPIAFRFPGGEGLVMPMRNQERVLREPTESERRCMYSPRGLKHG